MIHVGGLRTVKTWEARITPGIEKMGYSACDALQVNMIEYMNNYPIRVHFSMTEEQRDELQRRANQLDISSAALMRLLIKQLKNIKNDEFYF